MLIDGKIVEGEYGIFEVRNPYTGKVIGHAPIASEKQIREALDKAYNARPSLDGESRGKILDKMADLLERDKDELATGITQETGMSIKQAYVEVARSQIVFKESAKYARVIDDIDRTSAYTKEQKSTDPQLTVVNEPINLAVAITPFNLPIHQVAAKIGPAIAAGTCMVVKPSEKTPLSAMRLEKLLLEADVPPNMLNFITSDKASRTVSKLISHPGLDLVTFTGGTYAGKEIEKMLATQTDRVIKYVPELGGNAALTILDDADIDKAVEIAAFGAYGFNSGQSCTTVKRILVHSAVADEFVKKFTERSRKIKFGDPMDPQTEMGTVITQDAAKIIEQRVEQALADGAKLMYGNMREGALYSPTVLDHVSAQSELVAQETFGPAAPIIRINGVQEAIDIINGANYKLAGAVITKDKEKALAVANGTYVGQFNWNGPPIYRVEHAPFGGFGLSGNGLKEGVIPGAEGMRRTRTFYAHPQEK